MNRRALLPLAALLGLACAALFALRHGPAPELPALSGAGAPPERERTDPTAEHLQAESVAGARGSAPLGTPHTPARGALELGQARIAGWLRPQDERPWREAAVALLSSADGGPPRVLAESRCEPDGGFVLAAAHTGRALFVAFARGFVPRAQELELVPGEEQLFEDLELERGLSIGGRLSSNAQPLARFELVAIDERDLPPLHLAGGELVWDGHGCDWRFTTAESGADGRYSISGLHAGPYAVRVSTCRGPMASLCAADRSPRTVRVPSSDADFVFESSALALRFASAGQPLAGVDVELASGSWRSAKRSDEQGLAAFQLVPRMDCTLVATKRGYEDLRTPLSAPGSGASAAENFEMRAKQAAPEVRFLVSAPRGDVPAQLRVRLFEPGGQAPARDEWLGCTAASAGEETKEFVLASAQPGNYRAVLLPGLPWNNELEPASYIGTHCAVELALAIPAEGELRQRVQVQRRAALRLEFQNAAGQRVAARCTLRDAAGTELPIVLVDPALGQPLVGHELSLLGPTLLYSTLCDGSARLQVDSDVQALLDRSCHFRAGQIEVVSGSH